MCFFFHSFNFFNHIHKHLFKIYVRSSISKSSHRSKFIYETKFFYLWYSYFVINYYIFSYTWLYCNSFIGFIFFSCEKYPYQNILVYGLLRQEQTILLNWLWDYFERILRSLLSYFICLFIFSCWSVAFGYLIIWVSIFIVIKIIIMA